MKMSKETYGMLYSSIEGLLENRDLEWEIDIFNSRSKANNKYIAFIWAVYFEVLDRSIRSLRYSIISEGLNDSHVETALKKIFYKLYGVVERDGVAKLEGNS